MVHMVWHCARGAQLDHLQVPGLGHHIVECQILRGEGRVHAAAEPVVHERVHVGQHECVQPQPLQLQVHQQHHPRDLPRCHGGQHLHARRVQLLQSLTWCNVLLTLLLRDEHILTCTWARE
jgi:hypothetical protein